MNCGRIRQLQRFLSLSRRFDDGQQVWATGGMVLTWGDLRALVAEAAANAGEELNRHPPLQDSITCPACGRTSYNTSDILNGYCGSCHDWTTANEHEFYGERRARDFYGD